MSNEYNLIKGLFHHDVVEGSHYEIGKQQGELLIKNNAEILNWFPKKEFSLE